MMGVSLPYFKKQAFFKIRNDFSDLILIF